MRQLIRTLVVENRNLRESTCDATERGGERRRISYENYATGEGNAKSSANITRGNSSQATTSCFPWEAPFEGVACVG